MKRLHTAVAVLALGLLVVGPASGRILSDGTDTDAVGTAPGSGGTNVLINCNVLWFAGGGSAAERDRFAALGATLTVTTDPTDLAIANLSDYEVLVVAYTGPGLIGAYQPDIQMFVGMGRGLLIHQPNATGTIDYAPSGFGASLDSFWCNFPSDLAAYITDAGHPIMAGLTDADLSGDFDTVLSLDAGYSVLARNVVCDDPAVAAGVSGLGRVVLETGNASPTSSDSGSDAFWSNVFEWLCSPGPVSVEGSSWGSTKAIYR